MDEYPEHQHDAATPRGDDAARDRAEAVVAASDIGAIAYFSQRKVVDLMGLVSAPRTLPQNLTHHRPDVLIVMVDWFKEYARRDSTTNFFAFTDEDSTHKYTPIFAVS